MNSDDGACTSACKLAACGDGLVQDGIEECDDGNTANGDACSAGCHLGACEPSGIRAPLDTMSLNTTTGCLSQDPCKQTMYSPTVQSFFGLPGEVIECKGAATCVAHVGVATNSFVECGGIWEVFCDATSLGQLKILDHGCLDPQSDGCFLAFPARTCATIRAVAKDDGLATACCNMTRQPNSLISAMMAW